MNETYWQDIDIAPKDGTKILVWGSFSGISVRYWGENDNGDDDWCPRIRGGSPKYWMPLPVPPGDPTP